MDDQTATIDATENRRLTALDRAIAYHTIREATPADVVATATIFEEYLKEEGA